MIGLLLEQDIRKSEIIIVVQSGWVDDEVSKGLNVF